MLPLVPLVTIGTNRKLNTSNGLLAASGCFSAYGNQWMSFATTVSHCLPLATICNRWQALATISIDRLNFDFRDIYITLFRVSNLDPGASDWFESSISS